MLVSFSTRKVREFAEGLAQDLAKRYPPAIANSPTQMVSPQRLAVILDAFFARAAEFKRENQLGWYKKARLDHIFRSELMEMGYEEKFITVVKEGLTSR